MKAAVLKRYQSPLVITDVPEPVPGPGEVIVRTAGCGICRTDLHIQSGLAYRPELPHILGHEPAGHISGIGLGVSGWALGDRVAVYLFETCGHCAACHDGSDAQCAHNAGILGVTRGGGFAEFFRVRADNLLRVPETVDLASAGLASCAVITALHATRRAALTLGQRVAIVGAGGIGLIILQLLCHDGLEAEVFDPSPAARAAALAEGAAAAHGPDFSAADGGFDRVFDLVGTAASTGLAGRLVKARGRIVIIGEEAEFPAIDTIALAQREIEIVGSRNGARKEAQEALDLMGHGVIRPPVGKRVRLEAINEAFAAMQAGTVTGRIIVEFPQ
jgi:D-arabinose 1-dehydrogenase-like Zn-dependent alcohol dehydrogenase